MPSNSNGANTQATALWPIDMTDPWLLISWDWQVMRKIGEQFTDRNLFPEDIR